VLERSNDGKNRQHKAMTASRPFPGGDGISQRCRRKHFSALAREAFLITESWEASTVLLAFRSAFAGSISHRQGGREASAYAGISQCFRRKHFTSSERMHDGKHQPIAGRLDHSPMGGISQRQSESMAGSIDLLSASRSLTGERHFTAP